MKRWRKRFGSSGQDHPGRDGLPGSREVVRESLCDRGCPFNEVLEKGETVDKFDVEVRGRDGEAARLREALARCRWNREKAAAELGISRITLWRRMKRHGIAG